MKQRYTIGIDFGTLSGRAVLADLSNGHVAASAVWPYAHGVMDTALPDGTPLPDGWALQHPADYPEVLAQVIPEVLRRSGVTPEQVVGIGIDFTASTTLPVTEDGTPLCLLEAYRHEPHAYVKLWKHHGAQQEADAMTQIAAEREEPWLEAYGGTVCAEWSLPKLWQVLREAPHIYDAAADWVEAGDWIVRQLCGVRGQSHCGAGYKSFHRAGPGFPSEDYFAALDPRLRHMVRDKLSAPVLPVFTKAGGLTEEAAARYGLMPGTAVAVSMIDAHACVPAAGITGPGQLLAIIGTSACYLALDDRFHGIPGISGAVEDGMLPGCWGYEAGQSCVGDHFAWFTDNCVPVSYVRAAKEQNLSVHQYLSELAQRQKPGEHGLVALDWWNGNRSILADSQLSGVIVGMTLQTKPEELYRALVEATAYGARVIVEHMEAHGLQIRELFVTGGICQKNPMVARIYADILGRPLHIVSAEEGAALGSAIAAAAAAGPDCGGYDSAAAAINAMAAPSGTVYVPCPEHTAVYDRLYQIYRRLHDSFGREHAPEMHALRSIRAEQRTADGNFSIKSEKNHPAS